VNGGKQPLISGKGNSVETRRLVGSVGGLRWNGTAIFANGTVTGTLPTEEDPFAEPLSMIPVSDTTLVERLS
jgi:hypothetical protein